VKKISKRRLILTTESIRSLTDHELRTAGGAAVDMFLMFTTLPKEPPPSQTCPPPATQGGK
jgi:hypothetical protein